MSEPLIPGPERPEEAAAREKILADLREAFANGEEVGRCLWGVGVAPDGCWRRLKGLYCCPIARQLVNVGVIVPYQDIRRDAALRLGVDHWWVRGFIGAWDNARYQPPEGDEERAYFWGFTAGMAAREIEPGLLEGEG